MDISKLNGANSNGPRDPSGGQSHGQAALLLVESLMHALVEKGVISREEFIETVEGAAEVEQELVSAGASSPTDSNGSLLHPLAAAFRNEVGG